MPAPRCSETPLRLRFCKYPGKAGRRREQLEHPVVLVPNYGPLGSPPTCGQAFDVGQQYGLAQIMFAERQEPKKSNKIRRTQNDFGR